MVINLACRVHQSYSNQLKALEEHSSDTASSPPPEACLIQSPLKNWRLGKDCSRVILTKLMVLGYILRGIEGGFRVEFHGDPGNLRSRMRNMISAAEHTAVVAKYLDGERSKESGTSENTRGGKAL